VSPAGRVRVALEVDDPAAPAEQLLNAGAERLAEPVVTQWADIGTFGFKHTTGAAGSDHRARMSGALAIGGSSLAKDVIALVPTRATFVATLQALSKLSDRASGCQQSNARSRLVACARWSENVPVSYPRGVQTSPSQTTL